MKTLYEFSGCALPRQFTHEWQIWCWKMNGKHTCADSGFDFNRGDIVFDNVAGW